MGFRICKAMGCAHKTSSIVRVSCPLMGAPGSAALPTRAHAWTVRECTGRKASRRQEVAVARRHASNSTHSLTKSFSAPHVRTLLSAEFPDDRIASHSHGEFPVAYRVNVFQIKISQLRVPLPQHWNRWRLASLRTAFRPKYFVNQSLKLLHHGS